MCVSSLLTPVVCEQALFGFVARRDALILGLEKEFIILVEVLKNNIEFIISGVAKALQYK